jgi:hypothetical protein
MGELQWGALESLAMRLRVLTSLHLAWDRAGLSRGLASAEVTSDDLWVKTLKPRCMDVLRDCFAWM